jgi:hypothetical protein
MVLRALIMPLEMPDMHREASQLLKGTVQLPLRVSHVTIGEAFNGICTDRRMTCDGSDCALIEFNRLACSGHLLEVKGIGDIVQFHDTALELHRADPRLERNDCLILALAITDQDCDSFLTSDPILAHSYNLRDLAARYHTTIVPFGEKLAVRDRKRRYSGRGR